MRDLIKATPIPYRLTPKAEAHFVEALWPVRAPRVSAFVYPGSEESKEIVPVQWRRSK